MSSSFLNMFALSIILTSSRYPSFPAVKYLLVYHLSMKIFVNYMINIVRHSDDNVEETLPTNSDENDDDVLPQGAN